MELRNANVLVTGAASGIGRHLATRLARRGAHVLATDVDYEALESHADANWAGLEVRPLRLDVTRPEDWREALDIIHRHWGQIDLCLNVAGFLQVGYLHETDLEAIDRQIDVNLKGTLYGLRIVGRHMVDRGAGHIVNIGSLASLAPVSGLDVYSSSKFGVRGATLAAARALRQEGVDLSLVLPDAVDTPMLDQQIEHDEAAVVFSGGRPLTVEEVGDVIVERVLPERPLEVCIPEGRGVLARLTGLVPNWLEWLDPLFRRAGRRALEAYRNRD